jgi:peptidoglycan/xylan/chitin deacetylase (PgdA/CDA1 family)
MKIFMTTVAVIGLATLPLVQSVQDKEQAAMAGEQVTAPVSTPQGNGPAQQAERVVNVRDYHAQGDGMVLGGSSPSKPQVIILKLDDVQQVRNGVVHRNWQRVADYIGTNHLKASFGIICSSLETDNPAYFDWIKDLNKKGFVEFWLHGYRARTQADKSGEFEQGTFEEHKALLERSEKLAKEKLGFTLPAFGQHWSGTTDATERALDAVPEIKIWLYGPRASKLYRKVSLPRVMGLENPTFVPDFAKFKATYERIGAKEKYLVLQGHPPNWYTDERWNGFIQIVEFLRSKGCVFMTPSEYVASVSKAGK